MKAIIIGASSGIGRSLALELSKRGYTLGLVARRKGRLEELQKELKTASYIAVADIINTSESAASVLGLIDQMGGVDLFIVNSGVGYENQRLDFEKEQKTIQTNVEGFAAMATLAMRHFLKRGSGHLVGISSIAALRGSKDAPAYNASKAFVSNYLEGLRIRAFCSKKPIYVTDIRPGWVKTEMTEGAKMFWAASAEKAAEQIYTAIEKKKRVAYITRRWRLIAWICKLTPGFLIERRG